MLDCYAVLAELQLARHPRTFVAVGAGIGAALATASDNTLCVGVDPEPRVPDAITGRRHIEKMTSDDFFASSRCSELLGGQVIDLAFIDSGNSFEPDLRAFMSLEANAGPESLIAVHRRPALGQVNLSLNDAAEQSTDDAWRLILCLLDSRPDLEITVLKTPPSFLCLIGALDPKSTMLGDDYEAIVERYLHPGLGDRAVRRTSDARRPSDLGATGDSRVSRVARNNRSAKEATVRLTDSGVLAMSRGVVGDCMTRVAEDGAKRGFELGALEGGHADAVAIRSVIWKGFGAARLDRVIDDSTRSLEASRVAFETLFPFLCPGGIYAIEDWAWAHAPGMRRGDDGPWPVKPSTAYLVLEIATLCAHRPDLVESIEITGHCIAVRRGERTIVDTDLALSADFLVGAGADMEGGSGTSFGVEASRTVEQVRRRLELESMLGASESMIREVKLRMAGVEAERLSAVYASIARRVSAPVRWFGRLARRRPRL